MRRTPSVWLLVTSIVALFTFPIFAQAQSPQVSNLAPTGGVVGTQVAITGTKFGSTPGSSTVSFNGATATAINWSDTSIVLLVPTGAITGNVVVTVSGQPSNGANFTVTAGFLSTSSLNTARNDFTATLLNSGKVLAIGGADNSGNALSSAELFDNATRAFTATGSLNTGRWLHTATLLNNGLVLVTGGVDIAFNFLSSAELYNPATGTFTATGSMHAGRVLHTASLLSNGMILITGGEDSGFSPLATAELYDPTNGTFVTTGNMNVARGFHKATLLGNGKALVTGGLGSAGVLASAELYDPSAGTFSSTGSLVTARYAHAMRLLNNGKVLVTAGYDSNYNGLASAELYDAVSNTFAATGGMGTVHGDSATSTLLSDGNVLVVGGTNAGHATSGADLYDSVSGTFTATASLNTGRSLHTATVLNDGSVLVVGGINGSGSTIASSELYEPSTWTPSGLVSIGVTPGNPSVPLGATRSFVAMGTFSDNSTQNLASVIWTSSNATVATITNDASNSGNATALAVGSATVSACAGSVCGSTTMTVLAALVSITLAPSNSSLTTGGGQQITATGTFADNSTADLTTSVSWNSSDISVVLIGTTPGFEGFAMGASSGTATIAATLGSISGNTSVSVQTFTTPVAPVISSVSPSTGAGGTQVTISGSSFGTPQGGGSVWLGSTYGTVVTWNDTQIVATVSPISTSGTAQVQQNGLSSNAVPFNVNTATISSISPTSGVPGTQVTITGSGFGADQGSGQVWLGTANGVVQSWSDTQVVVVVAAGSTSGNAQILQNSVWSNLVPFTVNSLHISDVNPTSGGSGTTVTVTGTGFGLSQGNGTILLGSTSGQVVSWNDTQVVADVDPSALTGVVRIQQNGAWSNAISFSVPPSGGNALTIVPNLLNLVVGETHAIQALDSNSQPVTGLTWASSDTNIVSLSTDDPPILTALAAGRATITAGSASADVTVYSGAPPLGTVIWSNPGDGSGVAGIVPAVPSNEGVADVFAFQGDGTVQAITSDGVTAWTANADGGSVPDFQGGLIKSTHDWNTGSSSIQKLDGITGQSYPAYTVTVPDGSLSRSLSTPAVYTDGTVLTVDSTQDQYDYNLQATLGNVSVVGIDPKTGGQKFSIPLDHSTFSSSFTVTGSCVTPTSNNTQISNGMPQVVAGPIIAGDGYAYVVYTYQERDSVDQQVLGPIEITGCGEIFGTSTKKTVSNLKVMRVGSDGGSSKIDVKAWASNYLSQFDAYGQFNMNHITVTTQTAPVPNLTVSTPITNADTGSAFGWQADTSAYCASETNHVCNDDVPAAAPAFAFASTTGGSQASVVNTSTFLIPVLQAQDGTFYGTDSTYNNMIRFSQSGNKLWSVPNEYPLIATADDEVVGYSGVTYDNQGRATGHIRNMAIQSWTGNSYQYGSTEQVASTATAMASTFASWPWGGNSTATRQQWFPPLDSCTATPGCIGPHEAIYNALADLIRRLRDPAIVGNDADGNPVTLGGLAQSTVFNKFGTGWTTGAFLDYLSKRKPMFYNALRSNYCQESLDPGGIYCWLLILTDPTTVSEYFNSHSATEVETDSPSNPLRAFFRPSSILYPSSGMNLGNESTIFHEALHGWSRSLGDRIVLEYLYGPGNAGRPSCDIDVYIQDQVLSHAPGLDASHSSCP